MDFRVILHLDLDAFYCQVEHKRLGIDRSVPLAVRQWDGLIAVNYPAKAKGIKRGCQIAEAMEKCPGLKLVHVETIGKTDDADGSIGEVKADRATSKASLARYRRASFEVIKVMQKFSSFIERASIDEVYIDVTGSVDERLQNGLEEIALDWEESHVAEGAALNLNLDSDLRLVVGAKICKEIRDAIKRETDYEVSAGISHNKMLSKLASAMNKPNKQTIVSSSAITKLMKQLPYTDINGLGGKLGEKVKAHFPECQTAYDLQKYDKHVMQQCLGEKGGLWLHNLVRGSIDDPVKPNLLPKSLNACKSFPKGDMAQVKHWLQILCAELIDRIDQDSQDFHRMPRNLVLHARSSKTFEERSRQSTMPGNGSLPTQQAMFEAALKLFQKLEKECLPCSRLSVGSTDFVSQEKSMRKLSNFFSSSTNAQPGEQNTSFNQSTKRAGIEISGRKDTVEFASGKRKGDFFKAPFVHKPEPKVERVAEAPSASVSIPDLDLGEINRQKYILSMIQSQSQRNAKKAKTDAKAGQRNLSHFFKRKA